MLKPQLHELLFRRFMDQAGPDGGGGGGGGGGKPETFSAEYVRELRAENKGLRLKNTELQGKVDGFEKATADAVAKAVEENTAKVRDEIRAEVAQEADQRVLRAELKGEAVKAGLVDLDQLQLLDLSGVKLTNGKLEGADALFTSLKESKPYLFGQPPSNSSNPQNPPPANPPAAKKASEMTPEEYAKAKAELTKR
ncbi:phage scaffolding protein [Aquitalea aquatilis]|uniref:phage scaffolding protein n=1 Tax=Aquitalea aquatilis TaxID=1537400 RepID=UPI0010BD4324|nr:phage scaffolding protein [Aquitalea aquatilis]